MNTNLYKISRFCWAVTSPKNQEPLFFENVDKAADHLLSVGVDDEEIDVAIIDLFTKNNSRAVFGAEGSFELSDRVVLNGKYSVS